MRQPPTTHPVDVWEHRAILTCLEHGWTYTELARALKVTVRWLQRCEAVAIDELPVMEGV
jgi:hypothetical protein